MKKIFFTSFLALHALLLWGQNTKVIGKIVDAETKEPLPFVNVLFKNTQIGSTSDLDGKYLIETNHPVDSILVSSIGYEMQVRFISRNKFQTINFELKKSSVQLEEVIIKPGENPAHPILKNIIANKDKNNKENLDAYEYEVYNKVEFDVNNIPEEYKNKKIFQKFKFIFDNIDSSGNKPYLPMFITESVSDVHYRKKPKVLKEHIKAVNVAGVKNESINQFMGDVYQNVNAYDNFISVFGKSFISPIADFGLVYYKYYLVDSAFIGNQWCYKLNFMPRRRQEPTFAGEFWVHDSTFALKKIEVSIASDANINFVNSFFAKQEFNCINNVWILTRDELLVDFAVAKNSMGIYGRKTTTYKNFIFNTPKEESFYSGVDEVIVAEDASEKKKEFWESARHENLSKNEEAIYTLVDSIKNVPVFRTYVDIVTLFVSGYKEWGKIQLGPYFTTYSFNQIEDTRFRIGGRTSNSFSKRLELEGHLAYGLKDQRFKYRLAGKYFISKTPRLYTGFSYKFDMEQLGQNPNFLRQDNIIASVFRRNPFYKLTLVEDFRAYLEREWFPGFANRITVNHRVLFPTDSINFTRLRTDGIYEKVPDIITSDLIFYTRFAFKEKYVSGEFDRLSLGTRYPVVQLTYTLGLKGVLKSQYTYHKLHLNYKHYINTQPFGYFDYMFEAGKIFGKLPYPLLELHNGNETYSYDKYAFNMMNYFEFASDQFFSASFTHHFEGFFLDKIPLMRKLKWRELVLGKGVIGSLNSANRHVFILPPNMSDLRKPYYEAGVGVENILKILRVDALWRLSYLNNPNIQKFGIRATLQVKF